MSTSDSQTAYRAAGAVAFGMGAPLLFGDTQEASRAKIRWALDLARGQEES